MPITLSAETEGRTYIDGSKTVCSIVAGPYTSVAVMKGSARKSVPSTQITAGLMAQPVMLKLSADLKTFDLLAGVGSMAGYEVTENSYQPRGVPSRPAERRKQDGHPQTRLWLYGRPERSRASKFVWTHDRLEEDDGSRWTESQDRRDGHLDHHADSLTPNWGQTPIHRRIGV